MKEHFAARYVFHTHLQSNVMHVFKDIKVMTAYQMTKPSHYRRNFAVRHLFHMHLLSTLCTPYKRYKSYWSFTKQPGILDTGESLRLGTYLICTYKALYACFPKDIKGMANFAITRRFWYRSTFAARYVFHIHLQSTICMHYKSYKSYGNLCYNQAFLIQEHLCG